LRGGAPLLSRPARRHAATRLHGHPPEDLGRARAGGGLRDRGPAAARRAGRGEPFRHRVARIDRFARHRRIRRGFIARVGCQDGVRHSSMALTPDTTVTPTELARGQRALVQDAAWASLTGALYGGVILVGFALALGASPFVIGLLAAIPLISQAAQLPAIALVERVRQRRRIVVVAVTTARALILSLAIIPYLDVRDARLTLLVV